VNRPFLPFLPLLALALAASLPACADDPVADPTPVLVVAPLPGPPSTDSQALEDALAVLTATLTKMGHPPRVERVVPSALEPLLARLQPGLAVVLDVAALGFQVSTFEPEQLAGFDDRFAIDLSRTGDHSNPLDAHEGSLIVGLSARSGLGRCYAVYEFLRRLGARYYHPEDEWIPIVPGSELTRRAALPTALGTGPIFTPDFTHRSFSFHGAHPLEHLEAFSDARHPIDEALHVNDWIIKNRGDLFRGPGRGIAPQADAVRRRDELEAFRVRRQLRRQAGITLHNQQQGASADLDPTSSEPIADQITRVVAAKLAAAPDAYAFGIHFGPTELTTTPDLETVDWINRAGRAALALRPDLQIEVNDHTTGSQPVEHFDDLGCPPGTNTRGVSDYYDLAFHTDARFAARVHTVMFHPLDGPAPVYQQQSFAHKLCLMQQASAAGRPLVYFPEGAYWLSWDNAIPVYLPLYMATRAHDITLLRPLLVKNGGTLRDHRLFNSGQEWGYWQQDYAVGLLHWKSDIALGDILGELAAPLCSALAYRDCPARTTYIAVLTDVMAAQSAAFLTTLDFRGRPGGLYTYFAGEDPADELGARSGLEFRPVRLAFRDVAGLNAADLARFQSLDLTELDRLASLFTSAADRLVATRSDVPSDGLPWLDEVVDGLTINALRARHTRLLYLAVIALRDHAAADPTVTTQLTAAQAALAAASNVIARREAAYRYPSPQMIGGGVTPDTALANGTTYPYRVHTKTHLLTYWTSRQTQVEDLVLGRTNDPTALTLSPVFAAPDAPVTIAWPAIDGLTGTLDLGDASSLPVATPTHAYARAGIYRVEGLLDTSGAPLPVAGYLARTALRATMQGGDFELVTPDSDIARTVLASLMPSIRFALAIAPAVAPATASGTLALLAEPAGPDSGAFDEVVAFPATVTNTVAGQSISAGPVDFALPFPDPSTGAVAASVRLHRATLTVPTADLAGPLLLAGDLSIADLVAALVALAGFEANGATTTLAGILGFDPAAPPETVPFSAELTLTPDR